MNWKTFKEEKVLIWYDGPMVAVMRDGPDYYLTYEAGGPSGYGVCARIKKADLIAILKNEQPMNYAFENAHEKFVWDTTLADYKKVPFYNSDDLFDADVYAKTIGIEEKSYINELSQRR